MNSATLLKTIFLLGLCTLHINAGAFDEADSEVIKLNPNNYEDQINKHRAKGVAAIFFYKEGDSDSMDKVAEYAQVGHNMHGMIKVTAMDCAAQAALCEKQGVNTTPLLRVFPPLPMPAQDYEGEWNAKKIGSFATRFISGKTINLTSNNLEVFLSENVGMPKVILFTNKKSVPAIYRALSNSFDKKLEFGVVNSSEEDVCAKYKVKEFPKVMVIKKSEPKPKFYKGQMNYHDIFDWLNVFSETFVTGGGYADSDDQSVSSAAKPWLEESIPQLYSKSATDICLGLEGALCVIYAAEEKPNEDTLKMLKGLKKHYASKIDRGLRFSFMWMDVNLQTAWKEKLSLEEVPALVVLNPGKRKRFLLHEGELTEDSIGSTFDNISGGNARFKPVKGGLPDLETTS